MMKIDPHFGPQFYTHTGGQSLVLENTPKGSDVDLRVNLVGSKKPSEAIDSFMHQTEITKAENEKGAGPAGKEGITGTILNRYFLGESLNINVKYMSSQENWDKVNALPVNKAYFPPEKQIVAIQRIVGTNEKDEIIRRTANRIRDHHNEMLYVFDYKGNLLARAEGKEGEVGLSGKDAEFVKEKTKYHEKGPISLHNHPKDGCVNFNDLKNAVECGESEMNVVTRDGTLYRIKIPDIKKEMNVQLIMEKEEVLAGFIERNSKELFVPKEIMIMIVFCFIEQNILGMGILKTRKAQEEKVAEVFKRWKEEYGLNFELKIEKLPENMDS